MHICDVRLDGLTIYFEDTLMKNNVSGAACSLRNALNLDLTSLLNEGTFNDAALFKSFEDDTLGSVDHFKMRRLSDRFLKKLRVRDASLDKVAIDNFLSSNAASGGIITLGTCEKHLARTYIHDALSRYLGRYYDQRGTLDIAAVIDFWRFGPGVSNDTHGSHFVEKISQPMSCTRKCKPYVSALRRSTPMLALFDEHTQLCGVVDSRGSKLLTVPKNDTTARTIAKEPSGNMAMQLAVGGYLEQVLRSFCNTDLSSQQDVNKDMARLGSIDGTYCTIDLKNASDLISCELIRLLWPAEWFNFLNDLRSDEIEVEGHGYVKLNMLSTMGNGFTFPVMTLTIRALLYANFIMHSNFERDFNESEWAVFGDDIICPDEYYYSVVALLGRAGLVVNEDKSYHGKNPFRESCGGDFFAGHDVTPFYLKDIDTLPGLYVAINQVSLWCAKNKLGLHQLLLVLIRMAKEKGETLFFVPEWMDPISGIHSASLVKRRYRYLAPVQQYVPSRLHPALESLAIVGGYVVPRADGSSCFLPRKRLKTRTCKSSLPKGWTDGSYPVLLDREASEFRDNLLSQVLILMGFDK